MRCLGCYQILKIQKKNQILLSNPVIKSRYQILIKSSCQKDIIKSCYQMLSNPVMKNVIRKLLSNSVIQNVIQFRHEILFSNPKYTKDVPKKVERACARECICNCVCECACVCVCASEVATISKLLRIIGLFCKKALLKRLYSAEETYTFKEPTLRSQSIPSTNVCAFVQNA